MGSFIRFLVTPPPGIRPEHFRAFVLFSVGSFCGVLVHVVYLGLFWAFGVEEMVLVNLLSIPAYAMAHRWNRRGWLMATSVVAAFELCIHQVLAVHYIGWDAGLQYYIILIPSVVFSMPGGRSLLKLSLVGLAIATFLALLAVSQRLAPVHELPVMALGVLNYVNIATVFVLLGFFAFNYARAAEVAEARLRTEYQRAESLLHNILPVPIAERLKETDGVIADGFSDASVLFADLVGFTELSQRVAPEELVALLNEIFSAFDDRVEAHGLEKI
jgi:adenylate cyclase